MANYKSNGSSGGNWGGRQQAGFGRRQYSDKEKCAYYLGRGSALSRSEQGREKHVRALLKNDKAAISSYQNGRAVALEQKKEYLKQQRSASKASKSEKKSNSSRF